MITKLTACCWIASFIASLGAEICPLQAGPPDLSVDSTRGPGELKVSYQGRTLLVYAFATNQFKPYVRELHTLAGDNVLLDAPPDHLHHHGLMYAIRVNGINFWEEQNQPGYERSISLSNPEIGRTTRGLPKASFTQLLHWVSREDANKPDTTPVALLVEQRTLTISVDEQEQEVALSWTSQFQVGKGANKVQLTGSSYHGLGLRVPRSFDRVAEHVNSEKAAYPTAGKGDVTRARWSALRHEIGTRSVTLAMFGQPEAGRGLPSFFTMVDPFTYLSGTQGLDKAPLEYEAGQTFRVDYLLLVYSDRKAPEYLEGRYRQWTAPK
ncbi:MAG: DUF6807 family protein [Verrucomicrobiota bacterium]